jgi:hypothetical protein
VQYIVICGRQELGIVVGFDLDHEISHFTKRITTESLISWTEIYFTIFPFTGWMQTLNLQKMNPNMTKHKP